MGDAPIRTEQLSKVYGRAPDVHVAFTLALAGGSVALAIVSLRTFRNRVVT